jgi:hypothetical protein
VTVESPPCDCWAVKLPTGEGAQIGPVIMCFFHGWYRDITEDEVEEYQRLSDEIDARLQAEEGQ